MRAARIDSGMSKETLAEMVATVVVYRIGNGTTTVALQASTRFLDQNVVVEENYCLVVLNNKVREEHKEAFKELLTNDDDGGNCIMSVLGGKGSGTNAEQRNAVFKKGGPEIYKKNARFLVSSGILYKHKDVQAGQPLELKSPEVSRVQPTKKAAFPKLPPAKRQAGNKRAKIGNQPANKKGDKSVPTQ